jgi:hypothetical protein
VEYVNFSVPSPPEIHHISDFVKNILTFVFSGCILILVPILRIADFNINFKEKPEIMKKLTSLMLVLAMLASAALMTACGGEEAPVTDAPVAGTEDTVSENTEEPAAEEEAPAAEDRNGENQGASGDPGRMEAEVRYGKQRGEWEILCIAAV